MTPPRIINLRQTETAHNICSGDCCIGAVRRAYAGLLAVGQAETTAYSAAIKVFRWHHPEVSPQSAATLVRGWVLEESSH